MAKTLPQDLRDTVVAAIKAGSSCRAAAAQFGVSTSTAVRWRKLMLEHGRAIAKPRGGDRQSAKNNAHTEFLRQLLASNPDLTLPEIRARLHQRGAVLGISTVSRLLVRHGIKREKRDSAQSRHTASKP